MAKLFGTDGIRGRVGTYPLTEDMIYKTGKAIALYVKKLNAHKRKACRISIAKDTRTSGDIFESQLTKGITDAGVDVILLGVLPTPVSAYLVRKLNDDLGIVISASHNDIEDNGLKFFTHKGYKLTTAEEDEIESIIFSQQEAALPPAPEMPGSVKSEPKAVQLYIELLREVASGIDISKYKIAADCAFGAVSYIIPEIQKGLGLNILSINDTPNGSNINQDAGSLFPGAVSAAVMKNSCDVGFAFDGDADRVIACDEKGQVLDGDFIMAIIAKYLQARGALSKNTIVTTQMSNLGLEMSVSQWAGRLVKTDVGDKFVLEKMLKGKYNFGGEQSGHIILLDHTTTGDGLLAALFLLKIMAEEGKKLSELARCMYKFPQLLLNVAVQQKRPFEELPKFRKMVEKCEAKLGSKGRLYVRYSGTENKLRIMVEGQNQIQIRELAEELAKAAKEELDA